MWGVLREVLVSRGRVLVSRGRGAGVEWEYWCRGGGYWCRGGGVLMSRGRAAPSPVMSLSAGSAGSCVCLQVWGNHMGTFLNLVFLWLFSAGSLVLVPSLCCPR